MSSAALDILVWGTDFGKSPLPRKPFPKKCAVVRQIHSYLSQRNANWSVQMDVQEVRKEEILLG